MSSAAPYSLVEASPRFVTERIEALSAALALPQPVLSRFLFPANQHFYTECTESIVSLQQAARRVINHLGLRCGTVVVTFVHAQGFAGRIERTDGDWFIEIDAEFRSSGRALGAILAHECCHILVAERRLRFLGNALDEVHVDLAAMLAGLGALTLNGVANRVEKRNGQMMQQHQSFGYLPADRLAHAYVVVAARLGLSASDATKPLQDAVAKRTVFLQMTRAAIMRRLRRVAPLRFGAATDDAVVLECPSTKCSFRLRAPVGKRGTMRCPQCKTSAEFDGRFLVADVIAQPIALLDATPPPLRGKRSAFRLRTLLGVGLAAAILVGVGGIYAKQSSLGQSCRMDQDCRSSQCLHEYAPRFGLAQPGEAQLVTTTRSYCTQPCVSDGDCPDTMHCVPIEEHDDPSAGAFGMLHDRGRAASSCVLR